MSIISAILAGLGLFFFGMYLLTDHLKKLSGKSVREKITHWTTKPHKGLLWGGVIITITQSTAAATFILIGMMKSGMMTVKKSMPMIIGFNMFAGLIVFILVIDIKVGILTVLGLAALIYTSDSAYKYKNLAGAILGMSLLILGLITMQGGVAPLADAPWFKEIIAYAEGSFLLAFIIGATLTLLVQSSMAVIVFAIVFERAGLFSMFEVIMIVYGANVGSSVLTFLLASKLTGNSKQLAMFQVSFNFVGALIMVPLFYIEVYMGIPLVKALAEFFSADGGTQAAVINLIFNAVPGAILFFLVPSIADLLKRLWPESIEETISKPKYIHDQMFEDSTSAIDLIELEQNRLLVIMSKSFESIRAGKKVLERRKLHDAFETLGGTIKEAITDLTSRVTLSSEDYDRVNILLNNQHLLETGNRTLEQLSSVLTDIKAKSIAEKFSNTVVEGLDAILLSLMDVAKDRDDEDIQLISVMTSSDGNGISRIRSAYLNEESDVNTEGKMLLLSATNLTERLILLFGEIGTNYSKL